MDMNSWGARSNTLNRINIYEYYTVVVEAARMLTILTTGENGNKILINCPTAGQKL